MATPIFLISQLPDSGVVWWCQTVFVPLAIGLISTSLTFLAGLYLASRTEWYRRLARWEPYGKELWLHQITLFSEVFQTAEAAMNLAAYKAEELAEEARQSRREAFTNLARVRIDAAVFLPRRFNECYGKFLAHLTILAVDVEKQRFPELEQSLRRTWIDMRVLYDELLNEARASVGVEALSENALRAVTAEVSGDCGIQPHCRWFGSSKPITDHTFPGQHT